MPIRTRSTIATLVAFLAVSASAQNPTPPPAAAPLAGSVSVPAAAEQATLDGTISVRATLTPAPDGESAVLSYACGANGSAVGASSGATFAIAGSGADSVPVVQALPIDVGLNCSIALTVGDVRQTYLITLQGGLDAAGALASLVVRTIAAQ